MEESEKYKLTLRRRIGSRVRQARKRRALSQEELAGRVGIGNRYLGQVERAEVKVTVDNVAGIAHHMSMEVSELLAPPPNERHEPSFYLIASEDLDAIEQGLRAIEATLQSIARVRRALPRRKRRASK